MIPCIVLPISQLPYIAQKTTSLDYSKQRTQHTCPYIECELSIIDNKCCKTILSIVEVQRVEVDILKMHQNKLKIGNFLRSIRNILNYLLDNNLNLSYSVSFVPIGLIPHPFHHACRCSRLKSVEVTFDMLEKLHMCSDVLSMSISLRLRQNMLSETSNIIPTKNSRWGQVWYRYTSLLDMVDNYQIT